MIQWDSSQGCKDFSVPASVSVIYHIKKLKNKNHMIISIDEKIVFDTIQHPFMVKTLQKVSMEGTYINITKAVCSKPTANIILNGE